MKMVALPVLLVVMLAVTGGLPGAKATTTPEPPPGDIAAAGSESEDEPMAEPTADEDEPSQEHQVAKRAVFCPFGWSRYGNRCFRYFASAVTWYDAQRYCQAFRANLASVHSSYEELILRRLAYHRPTWIGFSDAQQERYWFWIDGTRVNYSGWCRGEPNNVRGNQDCLLLNWTSQKCWDDQNCGTRLGFICVRRR